MYEDFTRSKEMAGAESSRNPKPTLSRTWNEWISAAILLKHVTWTSSGRRRRQPHNIEIDDDDYQTMKMKDSEGSPATKKPKGKGVTKTRSGTGSRQ
jgi:hypothetical protein